MTPNWTASLWTITLLLLQTAAISTVILVATAGAVRTARRASAATRHRLWLTAVVACLATPFVLACLPVRNVYVTPDVDEPSSPAIAISTPQPVVEPMLLDESAAFDNMPHQDFIAAMPSAVPHDDFEPAAAKQRSAAAIDEPPSTSIEPRRSFSFSEQLAAFAAKASASSIPFWTVGVWSAIAAVLLARIAVAWLLTRRLIGRSEACTDTAAIRLLDALCREMTIRRPVKIRLSREIDVPMLAGFLRPQILLPAEAAASPRERLSIVLRHELAHVARRDLLTQLLADATTAVGWFQPLLWHAARRLRVEREIACDDLVLGAGAPPCEYADELLSVAARTLRPRPSLVTVTMAGRSTVEHRIRSILNPHAKRQPLTRRATACVTAIAAIVLITAAYLTPTVAIEPVVANETKIVASKDVHKESAIIAIVAAKTSDIMSITSADDIRSNDKTNALRRSVEAHSTTAAAPAGTHTSIISGTITNADGRPVADAFVSIVGRKVGNIGGRTAVIAETRTDKQGGYRFELTDISLLAIRGCSVMTRSHGLAVAWQPADISQAESIIDFTLAPEEPIELALVDTEGQPAANVVLEMQAISADGDSSMWFFHDDPRPQAVLPPMKTDENGRVTIRHVAKENGISLQVVGDEKFARQMISLHKGDPKEQDEQSRAYRPIVKHVEPGETATLVLASARFIEGIVYLGETNRPAANAKVTVWASQREYGSMLSIDGKTDEEGRFRMIPYSGVRFGVNAYPPAGTPYLPTSPDPRTGFQFEGGERVRHVEIRLPAGLLAQGRIIDAETKMPVEGASVQYIRREDNPHEASEVSTGWQNTQLTDAEGKFAITVLPGPGTLVFHAPLGSNYVLREMGSRELYYAKPGGYRHYAHAFVKIDPPEPDESNTDPAALILEPMTVELQPGGIVVAKLVDGGGNRIERALSTSQLENYPFHHRWRAFAREVSGGEAIFYGLEKGVKYPVFILDDERHLGARAMISLDNPKPTIVLMPLGSAKARFVDAEGKPVKAGLNIGLSMVARPGPPEYSGDEQSPEFNADETYYVNFNRNGRPLRLATDENGVQRFPMLIPGTTYRVLNLINDKFVAQNEFIAQSGEEHDMGDIVVEINE